MKEGTDFDYQAAYYAERGTRQHVEVELGKASREVERLRALLGRLADIRPEVMYTELGHEAGAWYACCGGYIEPGMDDDEGHTNECPWLQAKQALADAGQPTEPSPTTDTR